MPSSPMPPILHLRDVHLTFGGKPLLDGAELAVEPGERVALVGRNGKSPRQGPRAVQDAPEERAIDPLRRSGSAAIQRQSVR